MITQQKRKRIRGSSGDEVRSRRDVVGERNPGLIARREIVGSGGAVVDTAPFEKLVQSGLRGLAGRIQNISD